MMCLVDIVIVTKPENFLFFEMVTKMHIAYHSNFTISTIYGVEVILMTSNWQGLLSWSHHGLRYAEHAFIIFSVVVLTRE